MKNETTQTTPADTTALGGIDTVEDRIAAHLKVAAPLGNPLMVIRACEQLLVHVTVARALYEEYQLNARDSVLARSFVISETNALNALRPLEEYAEKCRHEVTRYYSRHGINREAAGGAL